MMRWAQVGKSAQQGSIIMINREHSRKIKRGSGKIETKKEVLVQERWANVRGKM